MTRTLQSLERANRYVVLVLVFVLGVWAQSSGLIQDVIGYWSDIVYLSRQHILLTVKSGALAIVIGIPLGISLSRTYMRKASKFIIHVLNIGATIPTLAILALAMSFLGMGHRPAIIALAIATLVPIVRNTYSGIVAVPAHLKEAAYGIGMRPLQMLLRVELPNALHAILAGIRTALAINLGTVPLAYLIGGGGLGKLIFTGIDLADKGMLLAGAIPAVLLAVFVDFVMAVVTFVLIPRGLRPLR